LGSLEQNFLGDRIRGQMPGMPWGGFWEVPTSAGSKSMPRLQRSERTIPNAPQFSWSPSVRPTYETRNWSDYLGEVPGEVDLPSIEQQDFSQTLPSAPHLRGTSGTDWGSRLAGVPGFGGEGGETWTPDEAFYGRFAVPDAGAAGQELERALMGASDVELARAMEPAQAQLNRQLAGRGMTLPAGGVLSPGMEAGAARERSALKGEAVTRRMQMEQALRNEMAANALSEAGLRRGTAQDRLDEEARRRAEQRTNVGLQREWATDDVTRADDALMREFTANMDRAVTAEELTTGRVDLAARLAQMKNQMGQERFQNTITRAVALGQLSTQDFQNLIASGELDRDTALAVYNAQRAGWGDTLRGLQTARDWETEDYGLGLEAWGRGLSADAARRAEQRGNWWDMMNYYTGRGDLARNELGQAADMLPYMSLGMGMPAGYGNLASSYGNVAGQYGQMGANAAKMWGSLMEPLGMFAGYGRGSRSGGETEVPETPPGQHQWYDQWGNPIRQRSRNV